MLFAAGLACTSDDGSDEAASSSESAASESDTGTEETEDCCEPEIHTCYLVGATTQCADLAALCQQCMMGCGDIPPDVCEMGCAAFCNPSP